MEGQNHHETCSFSGETDLKGGKCIVSSSLEEQHLQYESFALFFSTVSVTKADSPRFPWLQYSLEKWKEL